MLRKLAEARWVVHLPQQADNIIQLNLGMKSESALPLIVSLWVNIENQDTKSADEVVRNLQTFCMYEKIRYRLSIVQLQSCILPPKERLSDASLSILRFHLLLTLLFAAFLILKIFTKK